MGLPVNGLYRAFKACIFSPLDFNSCFSICLPEVPRDVRQAG